MKQYYTKIQFIQVEDDLTETIVEEGVTVKDSLADAGQVFVAITRENDIETYDFADDGVSPTSPLKSTKEA